MQGGSASRASYLLNQATVPVSMPTNTVPVDPIDSSKINGFTAHLHVDFQAIASLGSS